MLCGPCVMEDKIVGQGTLLGVHGRFGWELVGCREKRKFAILLPAQAFCTVEI